MAKRSLDELKEVLGRRILSIKDFEVKSINRGNDGCVILSSIDKQSVEQAVRSGENTIVSINIGTTKRRIMNSGVGDINTAKVVLVDTWLEYNNDNGMYMIMLAFATLERRCKLDLSSIVDIANTRIYTVSEFEQMARQEPSEINNLIGKEIIIKDFSPSITFRYHDDLYLCFENTFHHDLKVAVITSDKKLRNAEGKITARVRLAEPVCLYSESQVINVNFATLEVPEADLLEILSED
jgi:hypothetical protein